jgi:hypothetical protein
MFNILQSYGYPVEEGGYWGYESEPDLRKLSLKLNIWKNVGQQVPIADDDWYTTFHIPKPANYNELRKKMDDEKIAKQQTIGNQSPPGRGRGGSKDGGKKDKLYSKLLDFFGLGHEE